MLRNAVGVGGSQISRKKCYEGVRFNVINLHYEGGGLVSNFQEKSVTLHKNNYENRKTWSGFYIYKCRNI